MNAAEHYLEAERLLREAESNPRDNIAARLAGQAQVHAQLAGVAAAIDAAQFARLALENSRDAAAAVL